MKDKIAPVTVAASNQLSNGNPVKFNAQYQRQRPALLYANDAIYAGFGSFCDFQLGAPRGWLLGWNASNLTPFAANRLNDTLSASPYGYFLSSIWMSGSGPAADLFGNIYFATGNTDPSGTTYSPVTNIANTVAQVSGNLGELISKYTPPYEAILDETDYDLGSGGVLLLPDQSGPYPRLLVAGGKDGNMFLFDRDYLGSPMVGGPNYALDVENNGSCWCTESYFTGPDGIGRVVSSGSTGGGYIDNPYTAATISVWTLQTSPAPKFVLEGAAAPVVSGQDGGTFTVVSSNGTQVGTGIIWTIGRPSPAVADAAVILRAFAATPNSGILVPLFAGVAGYWPFTTGNANIVPVVANGKVFVAAYQTLAIFGLYPGTAAPKSLKIIPSTLTARLSEPGANEAPHEITGTLLEIKGSALSIKTRAGTTVMIDATGAAQAGRSAGLVIGTAFSVQGNYGTNGKLLATIIMRAKPSAGSWPRDR